MLDVGVRRDSAATQGFTAILAAAVVAALGATFLPKTNASGVGPNSRTLNMENHSALGPEEASTKAVSTTEATGPTNVGGAATWTVAAPDG